MQNVNQQTGFFERIRSWGFYRGDGWLGGVSIALAARLNIDVVLVRGILVAGSLIGLPFVGLYVLAWLFLPNLEGSIPIEDFFKGSTTGPIVVLVLISLLMFGGFGAFAMLIFGAAVPFGFIAGPSPMSFIGFLLLIATAIFVVWLLRKSFANQNSTRENVPNGQYTYQNNDYQYVAYPADTTNSDAPNADATSAQNEQPPQQYGQQDNQSYVSSSATQHAQPSFVYDEEEAMQQRVRQLSEQQRFYHEQAEAARQARLARNREQQRRNPKLQAAWLLIVFGIVGIASGVSYLLTDNLTLAMLTVVAGLGLAMIVSGAFKRRSNALPILAILMMIVSLVSVPFTYLYESRSFMVDFSSDASHFSPLDTQINLLDFDRHDVGAGGTFTLRQMTGSTEIAVPKERDLTVRMTLNNTNTVLQTSDVSSEWGAFEEVGADSEDFTKIAETDQAIVYRIGPDKPVDLYLEIDSLSDSVWVTWYAAEDCALGPYDEEIMECVE